MEVSDDFLFDTRIEPTSTFSVGARGFFFGIFDNGGATFIRGTTIIPDSFEVVEKGFTAFLREDEMGR